MTKLQMSLDELGKCREEILPPSTLSIHTIMHTPAPPRPPARYSVTKTHDIIKLKG